MNAESQLAPVADPAAWTREGVADRARWEWRWSDAMLAEIREATDRVAHLAPEAVDRGNFPLTVCQPLLAELSAELDQGLGFAVVAGFPADDYDRDSAARAFMGLSSYLGDTVQQNSKGDRIIDVMDKGKPFDSTSRGYHSKSMLPFHTDGAYLVGLLFLETALQGGESLLVSSLSIYNELVRRHPEHVARLMRGYYYDRRGDHAAGEPPVSPERIPVFSFHNGLLHCCYNRLNIDLAPAKTGEKLEPEDVAALDAVEAIAKDPEVHMKMVMNKGDMQFVNNFVTLHSRTEFADRPDGRARQLVRVWLDCPQGRRRGPSMLDLYTTSERRFNKFDAGA